MRIAYVTTYDATDLRNWSGLGYYIAKALGQQGIDITFIGPLKNYQSFFRKPKRIFHKHITKKLYLYDREPAFLRFYGKQVAERLKNINVDLIFSPGTLPICYLECNKPIVFWTDSTFAGMIDFYQKWSNLCRSSLKHGNRMEQAALSNCRLAIYASDWAAKTARDNYEVDPSKIKVVPFGANLECNWTIQEVKPAISQRPKDMCKLLFLGVDWHRKGGDIAIKVAEELNKQGLVTELCIIGCNPPIEPPDFVSVKGFISKRTQQGRNTLESILAESHFLILPSRAECYGVAIAEANSFGVPVIASDVGGIPTAVRNGQNGILLPLENFVEHACSEIVKCLRTNDVYREMAESSFNEYETRLNWRVAGRAVKALLEEVTG